MWIGALALLIAFCEPLCAQNAPQFAELGECRLESGEVIRDCRLEYRTFGELRGKGENAVLFPTWFGGQTENLLDYVGPQRHVDSSRYFVILVGAFGNGLSSSPSNSKKQLGAKFPAITIRDMVRAEHRFVTEKLGLERLHAVVGISMGGMQTFEWLVSFPDFMELAIPIVGSPRLAPYDLLLWKAELHAIEEAIRLNKNPAAQRRAAMRMIADIHNLAITSPARVNDERPRAEVDKYMADRETDMAKQHDPYDWAAQLKAMISHDVSTAFGGSLEKAAAAVHAKVLVLSSAQDHMVTPGPSLDFAKKIKAETLVLESACGHIATNCEQEKVIPGVRNFLEKR